MQILKGLDVTKKINNDILEYTSNLNNIFPKLAFVRIGNRSEDISYEKNAIKKMEALNIKYLSFVFDENISNDEFVKEFTKINDNPEINAILLFRPLPKNIDEKLIKNIINPLKDVDCISNLNLSKIFEGDKSGFVPCTAMAVIKMLKFYNIELEGKNIAVLGASLVVGRPMAMLLLQEDATVTICHRKTQNMNDICTRADIIISSIGKPKLINKTFVNKNTTFIDVGINFDENGKLCGDADFDELLTEVKNITPVPGGVGSVTTSVLAENVIKAFKVQNNL